MFNVYVYLIQDLNGWNAKNAAIMSSEAGTANLFGIRLLTFVIKRG